MDLALNGGVNSHSAVQQLKHAHVRMIRAVPLIRPRKVQYSAVVVVSPSLPISFFQVSMTLLGQKRYGDEDTLASFPGHFLRGTLYKTRVGALCTCTYVCSTFT